MDEPAAKIAQSSTAIDNLTTNASPQPNSNLRYREQATAPFTKRKHLKYHYSESQGQKSRL